MKNKYEIRGEVTAILFNKNKHGIKETIIDTDQLEKVKEFPNTWCILNVGGGLLYVVGHMPVTDGKRVYVRLHRWLTNPPIDKVVDHINRNTLDNRMCNLRIATVAENGQNRNLSQPNSISGVRGVSPSGYPNKKWKAAIRLNGKCIHIGSYETIEEAEEAVKKARAKHMPYSQEALSS